jgi:DNA end-binding protein Ku
MPRSIWNGAISFGLVSIGVKVVPATSAEHSVRFRQLHRSDLGAVRYRKVCELDEAELQADDIVRGYETADGRIAVVTDEDLDGLPLPTARTIEVGGFIDLAAVDPLRRGKSYYLAPDKTAAKPYALMREALRRADRGAVAKMAMHGRELLVLIQVYDETLLMTQLRWADEMNAAEGIVPTADVTVTDSELDLADTLINALGTVEDLNAYSDEYQAAVEEVITAKLDGAPAAGTAAAQERGGVVLDLMAILQQSVTAAQDARRPEAGSADSGAAAGEPAPAASKKPPRKVASAASPAARGARKSTAQRHLAAAPEPEPKDTSARKTVTSRKKKTAAAETPAPRATRKKIS